MADNIKVRWTEAVRNKPRPSLSRLINNVPEHIEQNEREMEAGADGHESKYPFCSRRLFKQTLHRIRLKILIKISRSDTRNSNIHSLFLGQNYGSCGHTGTHKSTEQADENIKLTHEQVGDGFHGNLQLLKPKEFGQAHWYLAVKKESMTTPSRSVSSWRPGMPRAGEDGRYAG